jgi:thioredoxin 1
METLDAESFKGKVFDFDQSEVWQFKGSRPAIIDFYADWCAPCRMLAPILDGVAERYSGRVDVYKVNTEASPEVAELFGIRSIPTVLFVPMTGEPAMNTGVIQEEGFEKAILELFDIPKLG